MFRFGALKLHSLTWAYSALQEIATRRQSRRKVAAHIETGLAGERTACFHLRSEGFTIVAERWKTSGIRGDIDLVAWQNDILCFIEVKTRTSKEIATAFSAVDREKRRTLRRLARRYLLRLAGTNNGGIGGRSRPKVRFDVVSVYRLPSMPEEIVITRGAFGWSEYKPG